MAMSQVSLAKARAYVNRLDDVPDHYLFFAAFVLGAVSIVGLKSLGFTQWIVTAVPCGIILAYAGLTRFVRGFSLRADRIGENVYYLGFLFTLSSLAVALYAFAH